MTELDAADISLAGARDVSRSRDGAAPSPYQVRFTNPDEYLDDLKADAEAGNVESRIVRVAIVNDVATLAQVEAPKWVPGGERRVAVYLAKYVVSSYFARRQLVTLSAYCGVSWVAQVEPKERPADLTRATALALQSTSRRLVAGVDVINGRLSADYRLIRRGGGVNIGEGDQWLAPYLTSIEDPEDLACATCGERVYYANNQWRHAATRRAEAAIERICDACSGSKFTIRGGLEILCTACMGTGRRPVVDHLADPLIAGRKA